MQDNQLASLPVKAIGKIIEQYSIKDVYVCLSGGMDSVCLTEVISDEVLLDSVSVKIFHINHGLSDHGDKAEKFCRNLANKKNLPIIFHRVTEKPSSGESLEDWARIMRYEYLSNLLNVSSLALTAHHAQDQTETIIQRILRGSGPYGLTGIPRLRRLGNGWLYRPFLEVKKDELTSFSSRKKLQWLEDPMNQDLRFTRNRIRKAIIPELEKISTGFEKNLRKLSGIQFDLVSHIDALTDSKIIKKMEDKKKVPLKLLKEVDVPIKIFVLHSILRRFGISKISHKKLKEILRQITEARAMKLPSIEVNDRVVRIYKGSLYVTKSVKFSNERPRPFFWEYKESIRLPWGTLRYSSFGSKEEKIPKQFIVKFRGGGEKINQDRRCSKKLKKIFQELSIPPWERNQIPIIYEANEVVSVGGCAIKYQLKKKSYLKNIVFDWDIYYAV